MYWLVSHACLPWGVTFLKNAGFQPSIFKSWQVFEYLQMALIIRNQPLVKICSLSNLKLVSTLGNFATLQSHFTASCIIGCGHEYCIWCAVQPDVLMMYCHVCIDRDQNHGLPYSPTVFYFRLNVSAKGLEYCIFSAFKLLEFGYARSP